MDMHNCSSDFHNTNSSTVWLANWNKVSCNSHTFLRPAKEFLPKEEVAPDADSADSLRLNPHISFWSIKLHNSFNEKLCCQLLAVEWWLVGDHTCSSGHRMTFFLHARTLTSCLLMAMYKWHEGVYLLGNCWGTHLEQGVTAQQLTLWCMLIKHFSLKFCQWLNHFEFIR